MSVENHLRERLTELRAQRDRINQVIKETEESLARHVRARERRERIVEKDRAWFAQSTEDERAIVWLRMQPGIGKVTADRLMVALGGAKGLWEKARGNYDLRVPLAVSTRLSAVESPPWNDEGWWV